MHKSVQLVDGLLRLCGGATLFLGLAFWLGVGRSLIPWHIRFGTAVVVLLWVIAGLAWRAGARLSLVAVAVAWGVLTWQFGLRQGRLLPGTFHWVVEVGHLLVGVVAMALAGRLAAAAKARPGP